MKKQLIIVGATLVLLAVGFSGCINETSENDEINSELNRLVGGWVAGIGSIEGGYGFKSNGTFVRSYGAPDPITGRPGRLTGRYELKDGKLILTFDETKDEGNPFFNNTDRIRTYNYTFSNNNTTLTLNLEDTEVYEIYEKTGFI